MAEFKVGGKVICVKDHRDDFWGKYPVYKNDIRTVRDIDKDWFDGKPMLRFQEAVLPINEVSGREFGYDADYFLPLDDFKEVTFTKINEEVPVSAQ